MFSLVFPLIFLALIFFKSFLYSPILYYYSNSIIFLNIKTTSKLFFVFKGRFKILTRTLIKNFLINFRSKIEDIKHYFDMGLFYLSSNIGKRE